MTTTAIVVQARMGSSRLPGKIVAPLAGVTLLERVVERILAAGLRAEVVVATTTLADDDEVRLLCARRGLRCYSGHPTDLLDRHVGAAESVRADVLVKIPSDCPLIDPQVIRRVVAFAEHHRADYDYVSNLHPPSFPDGNDVEVVPVDLAARARREALEPHQREHTTPYFWERPGRYRVGNVAWERGLDFSHRHRWTVDYPEDYTLVAAVYEALAAGGACFGLDAILAFLEAHPEIDALNAHHRGDTWQRRLAEGRDRGAARRGVSVSERTPVIRWRP